MAACVFGPLGAIEASVGPSRSGCAARWNRNQGNSGFVARRDFDANGTAFSRRASSLILNFLLAGGSGRQFYCSATISSLRQLCATAALQPTSNKRYLEFFVCSENPRRLVGTAAVIVCCLSLAVTSWASSKQAPAPQIPPNALVREAVKKELDHNAGRTERFRYRMKKVTPEGSQIKEYVETDAGTIARQGEDAWLRKAAWQASVCW